MVTIVEREAWGAKPPKHRYAIAMPTRELWLHHSAGSGTDEAAVRGIQAFHMAPPPAGRGWADIAYSFLLDDDAPDVDIFEGRGAGIAGGHTQRHNTISHAICIIGNYTKKAPTDLTLQRIAELVAHGHRQGWWPLGFTGGHRDASGANTTCPGDALHKLIPSLNAEARRIHEGGDNDMPDPKGPQPSWLPDDVIKRLIVAKVITTPPTMETEDMWRTYAFLDRTLTARNTTVTGIPWNATVTLGHPTT